jgi:tRNA dimethylallyltransferase
MTALDPSLDPYPLITVVGPTASGKSALAIALALRFAGEILSCDSVAVYRGFESGAAKPTPEERACVPHHMIDVASPIEPFSAGEYSRQARAAIAGIRRRGRLPIVAGGTGLYLRALLEGLFPGPQRDETLRARLRARARGKGAAYLHRVLARIDPDSAARIHAHDVPKVIRALEVCLSAGDRLSTLWMGGRDPLTGYQIIKLALDPERSTLYRRIDVRCRAMFEQGLVEETRGLLATYGRETLLGATGSPMHALGYRQARRFLEGELTLDQAIAAAQQGHRNYAKRQLTWFRNIAAEGTHWLSGFGDDPAIQASAFEIVARMLPR